MDKFKLIRARAGPTILRLLLMFVLCFATFSTVKAQGELGLSCSPTLLAVTPGGTATLTVSVDTAPGADLTVNLVSNNPSIAGVPDAVTIRAGETSAPVTVTGVGQRSTFITAATAIEQASCSVYVAPRLSGSVVRFPAQSVRVIVGPLPESVTPVQPVRVLVGPIPFAITQPVEVRVRAP